MPTDRFVRGWSEGPSSCRTQNHLPATADKSGKSEESPHVANPEPRHHLSERSNISSGSTPGATELGGTPTC